MWRRLLLLGTALLFATPALARHRFPAAAPAFPSEHQIASLMADRPQPPYPMNYADEAAQSLGVKGGRWDVFDTGTSSSNPLMPSLRGGVDKGGAMIRLQWR
jgi:hypothetical protein